MQPPIRFTMETVNDNKLAFLDTAVSREWRHHHQRVEEANAHWSYDSHHTQPASPYQTSAVSDHAQNTPFRMTTSSFFIVARYWYTQGQGIIIKVTGIETTEAVRADRWGNNSPKQRGSKYGNYNHRKASNPSEASCFMGDVRVITWRAGDVLSRRLMVTNMQSSRWLL